MHFSELVKGICHLSAARRQIGRKTTVFWSVKTEFGQGKVPLIQEEQLSVTGERMCTKYW